jgi:uncharacterized membrane protein YfcA
LITDPNFYLVAVPAVILLGLSKSGFGAGFGSLAVPMLALTVPVPQAAAILMPVLLVMDLQGVHAFRGHYDKALLRFMLPFGLAGILIGMLLFTALDAKLVAGIVGLSTLAFLAQRLLWPPRADSKPPPRWLGAILVAGSGFTSFIAHAGGPPMNAYAIPLKLKPLVFTATMSVFFFFINLSKWIPYAYLGLIDMTNMATSLMLVPLAPIGVWIGVRIAHRIQPTLFYQLVFAGMFLTGVKLVWDGFLAGRF